MVVIQSMSKDGANREWPRTRLEHVVDFRSGYRNTDTAVPDGDFPFYVCSNEILRSNEYDFDEEAVIMSGNNADGIFHLHHFNGKFAARQRTYVITPKISGLDCRWLYHQLEVLQRSFRAAAIGTTTKYVTIDMLRRAEILLPELTVQNAVSNVISDGDALLAKLDALITKKRDLKLAAMQQLLTGQTRLPGFSGEWEVKRFGDLFKFSGGHPASRDQLSTEGHCYLHYGDIHSSSKTTIDTAADYQDIPKLDIPLKRFSNDFLLADGDVVFVDASEDDAGTSKHIVVVNKDGLPFIAGLHTIVAKERTAELAHEYRRYCFQTEAIRRQFMFYAVGTKVSGISKKNIAKLTLPVPSVAEQAAIAAVLSDMDAELASLEARRDKIRALKQGMMHELLTGRIRLI